MMRETHELLDSIERKVQNCIGEGDSYQKLLFNQSHSSQRRNNNNNKDNTKTISTVRDRTSSSLIQTYKKNHVTQAQQTDIPVQKHQIANLNRTIQLYQRQVEQLKGQMKRMQQNYQLQLDHLKQQLQRR